MFGMNYYGAVPLGGDLIIEALGLIQANGAGNPWPVQTGSAVVSSGPLLGAERAIPKGRRL